MVKLPSKDQLLDACTGTILLDHPVLHAARKLAALHAATAGEPAGSDSARVEVMREIDRWVSTHMPQPMGAAYLHTESVGMVVDRFARYYLDAQAALDADTSELYRHFLWQRLAQLAVAYADLSIEISTGTRKLPDLTSAAPHHDSHENEDHHEQPGTDS